MVLTYFFSLIVIVISVFVTLFIMAELERMFREKHVLPFHICNVIITLMISFAANAVMTKYILGNEIHFLRQVVILLFIILPIYILGHFAFEKYKFVYRRYTPAEDGKVLVLNENYMKKKRSTRFKEYNAFSKDK